MDLGAILSIVPCIKKENRHSQNPVAAQQSLLNDPWKEWFGEGPDLNQRSASMQAHLLLTCPITWRYLLNLLQTDRRRKFWNISSFFVKFTIYMFRNLLLALLLLQIRPISAGQWKESWAYCCSHAAEECCHTYPWCAFSLTHLLYPSQLII